MRRGLNLVTPPKGVKVAGDAKYFAADTEDGDLEEAGLEYGGGYGGEEPMEEPEGEDEIASFQQAVEQDRANRGEMSPEEFDEWDMQWRARGKEAGLDEQEVDAFMDSIWESEGSEPAGYYD